MNRCALSLSTLASIGKCKYFSIWYIGRPLFCSLVYAKLHIHLHWIECYKYLCTLFIFYILGSNDEGFGLLNVYHTPLYLHKDVLVLKLLRFNFVFSINFSTLVYCNTYILNIFTYEFVITTRGLYIFITRTVYNLQINQFILGVYLCKDQSYNDKRCVRRRGLSPGEFHYADLFFCYDK